MNNIAGVDEVGRGCLAGPVVAAVVILNPSQPIPGLADSKALTAKRREYLAEKICESALEWRLGRAEVEEIDRLNILQATFLAMQRAVQALTLIPDLVLVDGHRCPRLAFPSKPIIGGDKTEPAISAASIVAKVARDREMQALDLCYAGYGFAQHKGYGTRQHLEALQRLGVSAIHRTSFAPVKHCSKINSFCLPSEILNGLLAKS